MNILDHGSVTLIETWGSDERIVEAARMSTDKGFLGWGGGPCSRCLPNDDGRVNPTCTECSGTGETQGDRKLLRYLYENKHLTPFEMAGMMIEVQAPIFVFREWHRHRTQSYNELSARYTALPDLFYVPSIDRIKAAKQSTVNKQASDDAATFTQGTAQIIQGMIASSHRDAREQYEKLLALGVAREVARVVIPVAQYSRMRASTNLRCWLMFLTLRMDTHAQWEIRQYANTVASLVQQHFPRTYKLFIEGMK